MSDTWPSEIGNVSSSVILQSLSLLNAAIAVQNNHECELMGRSVFNKALFTRKGMPDLDLALFWKRNTDQF